MRIPILILLLFALVTLIVFVGLNFRQLYSIWAIQREQKRLVKMAGTMPGDFHNPAPMEDTFDGRLSSEFWKYVILNGGGKVANGTSWHSIAIAFHQGLTVYHFPDAAFKNESSNIFDKPAAGQYNNATLIGGSGFQPTLGVDVVLEFSLQASDHFYGTAGVVLQPEGTLQKDGIFTKPFDMFGVSIVGNESSVMGLNGPLCYLALDWNPVEIKPLQVDSHTWHRYQLRLRWISRSEWLGIIYIDGAKMCSLSMPPFGPTEVHVWSDNYLVTWQPQRWWEIAPAMDLKFQDAGDKQFCVGKIKIYSEVR